MKKPPIKNYHRFQGYDYTRGVNLFITCSLKPRLPLMAIICGTDAQLTEIGAVVKQCLDRELARTPAITLMKSVIMADHIHLLIHLRAGQAKPLYVIGHFMQNFKRWSKYAARKLPGGEHFDWELNYHDRICVSRAITDTVIKYIENNPLKWSLMHGATPPLKVIEPLAHARLPYDEWWSGVGNVELLNGKIAAFRLSTKIRQSECPVVVARCLSSVDKGFIPAGTFISPCERIFRYELIARKVPFIKMVPDELSIVYRPKEDEPALFAEDRYLLLSRVASKDGRRYDAWHGINEALANLARQNGVSLYVCRAARNQSLEFQFS